jgi:hypothetical protein
LNQNCSKLIIYIRLEINIRTGGSRCKYQVFQANNQAVVLLKALGEWDGKAFCGLVLQKRHTGKLIVAF